LFQISSLAEFERRTLQSYGRER